MAFQIRVTAKIQEKVRKNMGFIDRRTKTFSDKKFLEIRPMAGVAGRYDKPYITGYEMRFYSIVRDLI